jgi:hypothetical protein
MVLPYLCFHFLQVLGVEIVLGANLDGWRNMDGRGLDRGREERVRGAKAHGGRKWMREGREGGREDVARTSACSTLFRDSAWRMKRTSVPPWGSFFQWVGGAMGGICQWGNGE